jgi:NAD(P)-dependent dehydrogenase (short-subunit alcohol dehydrogenase family)
VSELRFDGKVAIVTGAGAGLGWSQAALDAYGRVDILVNNAGILRNALFEDMTDENLDAVLDVHLRGAFYVTRPAWRAMRDQGGSRIVNTTSSAGLLGNAGFSNYAAAKGGVYGLTRVLSIEGAKYGIKVNAIAPTAATRMLTEAMAPAEVTNEAMLAAMRSIVSAFDPALVAPVVAYLAHEECAVTGEVYSAGAGQVSRFFLARSTGYYNRDLSPELVRDHIEQIRDTSAYTVPADTSEETAQLLEAISSARP